MPLENTIGLLIAELPGDVAVAREKVGQARKVANDVCAASSNIRWWRA